MLLYLFMLGFQRCVMMEVRKRAYYDSDCKEKHCTLCTISSKIHFILRGLPKEYSKINNSNDGIDSNYIFIPQHDQNQIANITAMLNLRGYFDHRIRSNRAGKNKKIWEIVWFSSSISGYQRVGQLSGDQNRLPFGKHRWKLSRRDHQDDLEDVVLKLSSVR